MECYKSVEAWYSTRNTILQLLNSNTLQNKYIVRQLQTLLDDLYQWSPEEEVCYAEFWGKITSVLWILAKHNSEELSELLTKLEKNQSIPEEYREIISKMLVRQSNK